MSYLAPLVGAASSVAPLLQSRQQHIDELSATHALHERAIEQARELHDEQVAHADELHDHALRHAQRLHAEEVDVAHKHHAEALVRAPGRRRHARGSTDTRPLLRVILDTWC